MPMHELELLDWRRRIGDLYTQVRGADPGPPAWRRWRAGRDALLRAHPQSPVPAERRALFSAMPFFDHDAAMRFVVDVEPIEGETVGDVVPMRPVGLVEVLGATLTVFWLEGYAGGLFLPFADATSGRSTYGGGRYLLDTAKGADLGWVDGRLVLDFNYAFHPSCAHDPAWTCPLAPQENRLPVEVAAGERLPSAG
jgi:uncharacterized protein (DUF1684 family)